MCPYACLGSRKISMHFYASRELICMFMQEGKLWAHMLSNHMHSYDWCSYYACLCVYGIMRVYAWQGAMQFYACAGVMRHYAFEALCYFMSSETLCRVMQFKSLCFVMHFKFICRYMCFNVYAYLCDSCLCWFMRYICIPWTYAYLCIVMQAYALCMFMQTPMHVYANGYASLCEKHSMRIYAFVCSRKLGKNVGQIREKCGVIPANRPHARDLRTGAAEGQLLRSGM